MLKLHVGNNALVFFLIAGRFYDVITAKDVIKKVEKK